VNSFQGIPEIGKYWNNLTNTDLGRWRAWLGYFVYVGSELIPNSLGLGREAVLLELSSQGLPPGEQLEFPFLKLWGLE
jgi:hypothetical protein